MSLSTPRCKFFYNSVVIIVRLIVANISIKFMAIAQRSWVKLENKIKIIYLFFSFKNHRNVEATLSGLPKTGNVKCHNFGTIWNRDRSSIYETRSQSNDRNNFLQHDLNLYQTHPWYPPNLILFLILQAPKVNLIY